jgi:hypothetical protein
VSLVVIGIVVFVVLIVLTNTKRWKRLAGGARRAKDELEAEATSSDPEDLR